MARRPAKKSCRGRRRFRDEQHANETLRRIAGRDTRRTGRAPVRAYRCALCGGYHLTHQEPRPDA